MRSVEQQRHAAILKAAEEFIVWLKSVDEYDEENVASLLGNVMLAAGLSSLQHVMTVCPGSEFFMFDLIDKASTSANTASPHTRAA